MRRPPTVTIATREDIIPSSSAVDSAMYERDKQIYKCSTMRQGGRFDAKAANSAMKPAILNCPLPEIPRKAGEDHQQQLRQHQPSAEELILAASRNPQRTLKLPPHAKAIPPPKILSPLPSELGVGAPKSAPPASVAAPMLMADGELPKPIIKSPSVVKNPPATTPTSINDESNYAVTEL